MTVSEAPVPTAPAHSRTSASWLTKWASGQGLMKTHNSIITVLKTNLLGAICRLMTLDLVLTGSPCSRHCCHGWACSWPLHGQETMEGNPWSCKPRSASSFTACCLWYYVTVSYRKAETILFHLWFLLLFVCLETWFHHEAQAGPKSENPVPQSPAMTGVCYYTWPGQTLTLSRCLSSTQPAV